VTAYFTLSWLTHISEHATKTLPNIMNSLCFQFVKLEDMQDPDIALECAYTTECAR